MNRHDIHTWKEGVKRLGEALGLHLLVPLGEQGVSMLVIPQWVLRFIMSDRIPILHLHPRPKPLMHVRKSGFGLSDLIRPYKVIINLPACKLFYWQELI